jgi:hypothetical protein
VIAPVAAGPWFKTKKAGSRSATQEQMLKTEIEKTEMSFETAVGMNSETREMFCRNRTQRTQRLQYSLRFTIYDLRFYILRFFHPFAASEQNGLTEISAFS